MENDLIGTFISIPAWKTFGQVIDQEPAQTGSDGAVRVLVQDHPEQPDLAEWYNLEPGQFEVEWAGKTSGNRGPLRGKRPFLWAEGDFAFPETLGKAVEKLGFTATGLEIP